MYISNKHFMKSMKVNKTMEYFSPLLIKQENHNSELYTNTYFQYYADIDNSSLMILWETMARFASTTQDVSWQKSINPSIGKTHK